MLPLPHLISQTERMEGENGNAVRNETHRQLYRYLPDMKTEHTWEHPQ